MRPKASREKTLHAKIGQLTFENDFYKGAHKGRIAERKEMIDREHKLLIKFQVKVLNISRRTTYYKSRPVTGQECGS